MYQRTYTDGYTVPENYSGIAVEEARAYEAERISPESQSVNAEPFYECECDEACEADTIPKKRGRPLPFLQKIEGLLHKLPFHLPRFEGEDFLLIGAALLLLFSKNGDKECALILLALLFIG